MWESWNLCHSNVVPPPSTKYILGRKMVIPFYCDVFYKCELPMVQLCTIYVLICIINFILFMQIDFTLSSYNYCIQSNHILNLSHRIL
jgi:hypothetical protein